MINDPDKADHPPYQLIKQFVIRPGANLWHRRRANQYGIDTQVVPAPVTTIINEPR